MSQAGKGVVPWTPPKVKGGLSAKVTVPGSKSLTNRYIVLALLAGGHSVLRGALEARDTLLMADAVTVLGGRVERLEHQGRPQWHIDGVSPADPLRGDGVVECGLSGTVMRFIPPVAALADGKTSFVGDEAASRRPMKPLLDALRGLGIKIKGDEIPFRVKGDGTLAGGEIEIDSSASSQFVSGLLLAACRASAPLTVRHVGDTMPSNPHVAMTCEVLSDAGVTVERPDEMSWRIEPSPPRELDVDVEPDLSSAAPFLAAPLVAGGKVLARNWPSFSHQAGFHFPEIVQAFGGEATWSRKGLKVSHDGPLHGVDVDLRDYSELLPVTAALAACAKGPSRIRGVGHTRGHETNRLDALATELRGVGAEVDITDDGLRITPKKLKAHDFATYGDHRMAHAACLLALRKKTIRVVDVATTAKTMPGFPSLWADMIRGEGEASS